MINLSYILYFSDGTTFEGKSLGKDWDKAPDKPIKKMVYLFGTKKFVLENFKAYHHLVQYVSKFGKKTVIPQILLIGRKENESHLIIIDFKNKRVYKEVVEIGKEYQTLILNGWKKGSNE